MWNRRTDGADLPFPSSWLGLKEKGRTSLFLLHVLVVVPFFSPVSVYISLHLPPFSLCDRTAQSGCGREPQIQLIPSSTFLDMWELLFMLCLLPRSGVKPCRKSVIGLEQDLLLLYLPSASKLFELQTWAGQHSSQPGLKFLLVCVTQRPQESSQALPSGQGLILQIKMVTKCKMKQGLQRLI